MNRSPTAAGAKIAAATGQPGLASLPRQAAEAFCRVRFGGLPLDNPQAEAVEHALADLAACSLAAGSDSYDSRESNP